MREDFYALLFVANTRDSIKNIARENFDARNAALEKVIADQMAKDSGIEEEHKNVEPAMMETGLASSMSVVQIDAMTKRNVQKRSLFLS